MALFPPTAPAERFALILESLCRAVAAQAARERPAERLFRSVWSRLRRCASRFATLAARIRPGAPPRPSLPRTTRSTPAPKAAAPQPPLPQAPAPPASAPQLLSPLFLPPLPLPRSRGWLGQRVPATRSYASQLHHLLAEPEMAALLAASPGLRRMLRPLCHMLGIKPPNEPAPAPTSAPAVAPTPPEAAGPPPPEPPAPEPPAPNIARPAIPRPAIPTLWPPYRAARPFPA